ncbi:MAG: hypothetical protein F6K36_15500 [Symploca sp. SIO3C6]|nr:hypothetical protein [Symploca sp. SIO3C6]
MKKICSLLLVFFFCFLGITVSPHKAFAYEPETGARFYYETDYDPDNADVRYFDLPDGEDIGYPVTLPSGMFKSVKISKKSEVYAWKDGSNEQPDFIWNFNQPDISSLMTDPEQTFTAKFEAKSVGPERLLSVSFFDQEQDDQDCFSIKVHDVDDPEGDPVIVCANQGYEVVGSILQKDIDEQNPLEADIFHPFPPTGEYTEIVGYFVASESTSGHNDVEFKIDKYIGSKNICWQNMGFNANKFGHAFNFQVVEPFQVGPDGECIGAVRFSRGASGNLRGKIKNLEKRVKKLESEIQNRKYPNFEFNFN